MGGQTKSLGERPGAARTGVLWHGGRQHCQLVAPGRGWPASPPLLEGVRCRPRGKLTLGLCFVRACLQPVTMLRTLALAALLAAASAFSPAQLPLRSRQVASSAPVCAMQGPAAQLSKVRKRRSPFAHGTPRKHSTVRS